MIEVVTHAPNIQDESLSSRVAKTLTRWQPAFVEIQRRVPVRGQTGIDHVFDFVSMPIGRSSRPVALKLLPPSVGPQWQVSRYGFLALDIEGTPEGEWSRLAVVSKVEEWPQKAIEAVRSLSRDVILLETDREEEVERVLPRKMDELTEAA